MHKVLFPPSHIIRAQIILYKNTLVSICPFLSL